MLVISSLVLALRMPFASATPSTIIVPDDYPKIQEAIDHANVGDTVFVKAGVYNENLTVDRAIQLQGENEATTIIDVSGRVNVSAIFVQADNVTVCGFTIQGPNPFEAGYEGISVQGDWNNISRNSFRNLAYSLTLHEAAYNRIEYNTMGSSGHAVYLHEADHNMMTGNIITSSSGSIYLNQYNYDNLIENNTISGNYWGITVKDSWANIMRENNISRNYFGAYVEYSFDSVPPPRRSANIFYHNDFVNNTEQVTVNYVPIDVWDDGYPSGGNYWSDFAGIDVENGPYQNETGSDGIVDVSYVIDAGNIDHYPLVKPWRLDQGVAYATIDIDPSTVNLKIEGTWITAYVEFRADYNVSEIDVLTVMLENVVHAELSPTVVGDYDNDTIPDLMVKFNRTAFSEIIISRGTMHGSIVLNVAGRLLNGTMFEGRDVIRVRMPGDTNSDGKVDVKDVKLAALAYGVSAGRPRWNPDADENEDGRIDAKDLCMIARNFGKTYT